MEVGEDKSAADLRAMTTFGGNEPLLESVNVISASEEVGYLMPFLLSDVEPYGREAAEEAARLIVDSGPLELLSAFEEGRYLVRCFTLLRYAKAVLPGFYEFGSGVTLAYFFAVEER